MKGFTLKIGHIQHLKVEGQRLINFINPPTFLATHEYLENVKHML